MGVGGGGAQRDEAAGIKEGGFWCVCASLRAAITARLMCTC